MFEAMIWPRVEVSARHLFQRSVEEMRSRCAVDQKVGPNSDPGYTLPENKIETNASTWPASLVRVCLVLFVCQRSEGEPGCKPNEPKTAPQDHRPWPCQGGLEIPRCIWRESFGEFSQVLIPFQVCWKYSERGYGKWKMVLSRLLLWWVCTSFEPIVESSQESSSFCHSSCEEC